MATALWLTVHTHKRITFYPALALAVLVTLVRGKPFFPGWIMRLMYRLEWCMTGDKTARSSNAFARYLDKRALRSQLRALNRVIQSSPSYDVRTWCRGEADRVRTTLSGFRTFS
jgi:hypothetical protein